MKSLKQVLMERDGISSTQANVMIEDARETLAEYIADGDLDSAETICEDAFGLEPDFLIDLMY